MHFELYAVDIIRSVLQLEFEKGRVLVACKGTLRREAPRRGGCGKKDLKEGLWWVFWAEIMCIFYCVKMIDD